ncbi:hypothetical protein GCM10010149_19930 [Nonomuraea roseoviolacea subsp. roseoviolacea]
MAAARAGFRVRFAERAPDMIAIGGTPACDSGQDVTQVDVAAMEADWNRRVRAEVGEPARS